MAATFDFVNTDAETIYQSVMGALMDGVNEPLYPGDERRIFGEAVAAVLVSLYNDLNDAARQRTLAGARGAVLDAIGERVQTPRLAATKAAAVFRFTASAAQSTNIIIPAGTRVTSDGSLYFATDHAAVLQAGELSADIPATCTEGGVAYNGYTAGTVNVLVDLIPYIGSAQNITVTAGGDDGEPYNDEGDNRYRERIRLAPSKWSSAGPLSAYEYFALSADPDIVSVKVTSPSACVVKIVPLMTGGLPPDEDTIAKVKGAFSDDVRVLTDLVRVVPPEQVSYDIEIVYYCNLEDEADVIQTVEGVGGAIDHYNEWQVSALGRNINPDQLRKYVLSPDWEDGLKGASRIVVTKPAFIELSDEQVAKFSGNLTVSHQTAKE